MNVTALNPLPQDGASFQLNAHFQVPDKSGCYVLTTFDGHILYIGQSVNLRRRFEEHLDNPDKTCLTEEGRAIWFYWLLYPNINLNALERGWINAHTIAQGQMPIMNSIAAPV